MNFIRQWNRSTWRMVALAGFSFGVVFAVAAILINIFERKQEGRNPFFRVVELNDETEDPAIWGKNFPLHYDDYLKTTDQVRTRFGGSEAIPRTPTSVDPRSIVAQSKLEEDARLKSMWAGYAFSKDFREERGHAFMLEDQIYTERQHVAAQPGTCINCHASTYVPMMRLGDGDLQKGFKMLNSVPYQEARKEVKHPVTCIDCHDSQSLKPRITRPAFMEGMRVLKASQGIQNYDVNAMATRQEMRSYVCGQCHVEYYFKGPNKELTFPWSNGLKADEILDYYEQQGFKDWTHADTGAPALKAQHPEFELWSQGTHAKSGVTCADCHMPYKRVGAMKISDHHVRSPLLNINNACQICHHVPESELSERVNEIQHRHFEMRNRAMNALIELIGDLKTERAIDPDSTKLKEAQAFQRKSQFLIDFVEAENSTGFHAPQEAARVMSLAIDYARKGQIKVREK